MGAGGKLLSGISSKDYCKWCWFHPRYFEMDSIYAYIYHFSKLVQLILICIFSTFNGLFVRFRYQEIQEVLQELVQPLVLGYILLR